MPTRRAALRGGGVARREAPVYGRAALGDAPHRRAGGRAPGARARPGLANAAMKFRASVAEAEPDDVSLKAVEASGLSIVYGHGHDAVHAVKGVSFTVGDGEAFGIVGESGSGKSTILRVVAGVKHHWIGRALI